MSWISIFWRGDSNSGWLKKPLFRSPFHFQERMFNYGLHTGVITMLQMPRVFLLFAIYAAATSAEAQNFPPGQAPKTVRAERILAVDPSTTRPLTALSPEGLLYVDWDLAERLADGSMEQPRTEFARMLLALRDGQWKHMPK